jgi:hypothetical protein
MVECKYNSTLLHFSIRWRWVVRFILLPLYALGKSPRYASDRRLGEPESCSGRCGEMSLAPTGNRTLVVQPVDTE